MTSTISVEIKTDAKPQDVVDELINIALPRKPQDLRNSSAIQVIVDGAKQLPVQGGPSKNPGAMLTDAEKTFLKQLVIGNDPEELKLMDLTDVQRAYADYLLKGGGATLSPAEKGLLGDIVTLDPGSLKGMNLTDAQKEFAEKLLGGNASIGEAVDGEGGAGTQASSDHATAGQQAVPRQAGTMSNQQAPSGPVNSVPGRQAPSGQQSPLGQAAPKPGQQTSVRPQASMGQHNATNTADVAGTGNPQKSYANGDFITSNGYEDPVEGPKAILGPPPAEDDPYGEAANGLNSNTRRLPGDERSAEEIIDSNYTLANLANGHKERLKKVVGDFENDADAAWRASVAINQIQNYDSDGNVVRGYQPYNGSIDGLLEEGGQVDGTEAERLGLFFTQGYSSLKGGDAMINGLPPSGPSDFDRFSERPEGDERSAEEIISDTPVLAHLAEREKQKLKESVGDFETDADAAFRASEVLNLIQNCNYDGSERDGEITERVDGYYDQEGGADEGTQAKLLEDFFYYGFGVLENMEVDFEAKDGSARLRKAVLDEPLLKMSEAVMNGDVDAMKEAMNDTYLDVNRPVPGQGEGNGLLVAAMDSEDPSAAVQFLVEDAGIDLATAMTDDDGNTFRLPDMAEDAGHKDISIYLQNQMNRQLLQAAQGGDSDRIGALVSAGADPHMQVSPGVSLLDYAAHSGDFDLTKAILEAVPEADRAEVINAPNENGLTTVLAAAAGMSPGSLGGADVYEYLTELGGDTSVVDPQSGITASELFESRTVEGMSAQPDVSVEQPAEQS